MARPKDGELFLSFLPVISERATTTARRAMRDWGLQRRSERSLEELARMYGAKLRGWIEYYGSYGKWRLSKVFSALNNRLVRWANGNTTVPAARRDTNVAPPHGREESCAVPTLGGRIPAIG